MGPKVAGAVGVRKGGRAPGAVNYRKELLVNIIASILPIGGNEWERLYPNA
jgi:hypothetical protein